MRFGAVPVDEAEGCVLAHTLRLERGVFKKGRLLEAGDLERLRRAGHDRVTVACLEEGDVGEDAAAATVAAAAAGAGTRVAEAFTGRCNLHATARGLVAVDEARVDRVNSVHEGMTLATVRPWAVVGEGQLIATVKVIPFALPGEVVRAAADQAEGRAPLVRVAPLRPHRVGLVLTRLPGTPERQLDTAARRVGDRLVALGSELAGEIRCSHAEQAVAEAVVSLRDRGCAPILVFGASAVVDREDVVPAGIVRAGGTIEHFGMPVDPGNLLLLAHLGPVPVVGAPGCARSPKTSGFDFVLHRLLAGVPVGSADLVRMGAGGLLEEIPSRPQPRSEPWPGQTVDAVVLAAGRSRRMGEQNKLLAELEGEPLVRRVVRALQGARVREVLVVTGHQRQAVTEALAGTGVRLVHNPGWAQGMSTSLRAGLEALRDDADGAVIALGDMPFVRPEHVDALVEAFDPVEGRSICVPEHRGKRGNPVLWAARWFPEMKTLGGDVGARSLLMEHPEAVHAVPVDDEGVVRDVDTPEALAALRRH